MRVHARFAAFLAAVTLSIPAVALERVGVSVDAFLEGSSLDGEQWINATRIDESFTYGAAGLSGTAWGLWQLGDRWRLGPALRVVGPYSAAGRDFGFGALFEPFALGEYALPNVIAEFDAMFTARLGLAVLIPGGAFGDEIARLQREGAAVNGLPRLGWLMGAGLATRRKLGDRLFFRADLGVQYEGLSLFMHDETIDGLRLRKNWGTNQLRATFSLALEFGVF